MYNVLELSDTPISSHHLEVTTLSIKSGETSVFKIIEQVLTKEQLSLLKIESEIGKITLQDTGIIDVPDNSNHTSDLVDWKGKKLVLDSKSFNGATIVIFNSHDGIPEGCPSDLGELHRAGEYDAKNRTIFTDISGSWSYLYDKYQPQNLSQNVRHELRHDLVSSEDEKRAKQSQSELRRVRDIDLLEELDPELARQLSYLDELHSQFFDTLEGDIKGYKSFRTIDSPFYSIQARGKHLEVASLNEEGKESARSLFSYLQGFILLQRMNEQDFNNKEEILNLSMAAGVLLATERSLSVSNDKIKILWQRIMQYPSISKKFTQFLDSYEPSEGDNTPVMSQELRTHLLNNEINR